MQLNPIRLPDGQTCTLVLHPSAFSIAKRTLDILGACLGLLLTAVLLPWIALSIRRDSPGPIFFSQERIGLGGKPFRIYKFRTMVVDAERRLHEVRNELADPRFFKNRNDARVTRFGAFLRRTSLDEFPQFWNVLVGQMSLVGTRPPLPREVAHYDARQMQRLAVKPGLTGLWQVSGRSEILDFDAVVALDLAYQHDWSLLLDLRLLLKTVIRVLAREGAF